MNRNEKKRLPYCALLPHLAKSETHSSFGHKICFTMTMGTQRLNEFVDRSAKAVLHNDLLLKSSLLSCILLIPPSITGFHFA